MTMRHPSLAVSLALVALVALVAVSLAAPVAAQQAAGAPPRAPAIVEVELAGSNYRLSGGQQPWRELSVRVDARFDARAAAYGLVSHTRRFGLSDTELAAGTSHPLGPRWTAGGDVTGSTTHRVRAQWSAGAWVRRSLGAEWGVELGVGHREYTAARLQAGTLTVERYFGHHRLAYALGVSNVRGADGMITHRAQAMRGDARGDAITLGVAAGREAENVGVDRVLVASVRSVDVWGLRRVTSRWKLMYAIGLHRYGEIYTRSFARLGVRLRLGEGQ